MKPELGHVIARRNYVSTHDPSRPTVVEVEIAAPAKSLEAQDEFMCSFRLKAPSFERTETVYGIDALQALLLALGYLAAVLRELETSSNLPLSWVGGDHELGIRIPNLSEGQPPAHGGR